MAGGGWEGQKARKGPGGLARASKTAVPLSKAEAPGGSSQGRCQGAHVEGLHCAQRGQQRACQVLATRPLGPPLNSSFRSPQRGRKWHRAHWGLKCEPEHMAAVHLSLGPVPVELVGSALLV